MEVLVSGPSAFAPVLRYPQRDDRDFVYLTDRLTPEDYPIIRRSAAVICEQGGTTDHGAVICRILGCSVVRADDATRLLSDGMVVGVDGATGVIGLDRPPEEPTVAVDAAPANVVAERELALQVSVVGADEIRAANRPTPGGWDRPPISRFFLREELFWATSGLDPFAFLAERGVEATARLLADWLGNCLGALGPSQSLNYRALDWRRDSLEAEPNPELGLHGIRQLLVEPRFLAAELIAIELLGERGFTDIVFSLPFVTDPSEVDAVRELIGARPLRLGLFVETPAAASELGRMIGPDITHLSIGTKDLAQLILACDRGNASVRHLYSCTKPAVISAINGVLETASRHGVPVMVFTLLEELPVLAEHSPGLRGVSVCCGEYLRMPQRVSPLAG